MEKPYVNDFRNVLRRLNTHNNSKRYNSICTNPCNTDEERMMIAIVIHGIVVITK